jgi:hypothetical protein
MSSLPIGAVPAAEFLVRHMYRPIDEAAGSGFYAVAETENPRDDIWFWSDDNAKILEFMSRPELWRRFPREISEILRFVTSMCHGPFIFRRVSRPRLEAIGEEAGIAGYRHSLMQLKHDSKHGIVVAGVRFHDERNVDNVTFGGNYVEFTHRGQRLQCRLGDTIKEVAAEQRGHRLQFRHSGEVYFTSWWGRRRLRLGRVAYTYTFDACSMVFEVEAALDLDPGVRVSDVVLGIGHAGLDLFKHVISDASPSGRPLFTARKRGARMLGTPGAGYYAFRSALISGDALALHSIPRPGQSPSGIETAVEIPGRLGWAIARYAFPGPQHGTRLVAGEYKLLTAGGFYNRIADYAGFLRNAVAAKSASPITYDFSISYDYGVTINAFAKCFAAAIAEPMPHDAASSPQQLRSLFDQMLQHYFALYVEQRERPGNAIYSREIAFVILGVATMYRATGCDDYCRQLERLCDMLLDLEVRFDDEMGVPASGFLMRKDNPNPAYLDCLSSALLALTQAARFVADRALPLVIERGLASYCLAACDSGIDTVAMVVPGHRDTGRTETAFWNFKAGLTLRFFAALRNSPSPALQAIAARHGERIALFETILQRQLLKSVTERGECIELRTSVLSGETNSETQPWAMLGLLGHPVD